jgi:hypothetical protein
VSAERCRLGWRRKFLLMKTSNFFTIFTVFCCLVATGCGTQTSHPNQLNAFDGASFDSLTLAHGALTSLRAQITANYPSYDAEFNQAAATYTTAYNAYALYRAQTGSQAELTVAIDNLAVSIVALENVFQADMHASPALLEATRKRAETLRQRAAGANVAVSDILTELEIAAAVARAVPAAGPYAALASMVIQATSQALADELTETGEPIDLSVIQPVAAI